jgi:glutathione peroxidase
VGIINGGLIMLHEWKGKKILIVNTASDCGYTEQYKDLETLHRKYGNSVKVIAFPSNDFGEQEKGSDAEIIHFCQDNFGVHFPVAKKTTVIKSADQHPVFKWLTSKDENGWNDHAPKWNFCKYLINEQGILTHYFDPTLSPLSKTVLDAIKQ